ncbi:MAG: hypothetical protein KatS3mg109_1466 [Pirellulaceae bacterium]|nr:MAG: hypothetical protein KatS3mg109_1466 [Pirellulaceae bacterium]GIW93248.1 MAG: hypothetical protein KatS3mg110_1289 [Pirellulaceae bacterium]
MSMAFWTALLLVAPVAPPAAAAEEFLAPVPLEAAGQPIDTEVGHAAPFVGDFDGDGVKDLLVGQFGGGALWIFRNVGTNREPKLDKGFKFQDGRPEGCVPAG